MAAAPRAFAGAAVIVIHEVYDDRRAHATGLISLKAPKALGKAAAKTR
jgi:hypothetical protein